MKGQLGTLAPGIKYFNNKMVSKLHKVSREGGELKGGWTKSFRMVYYIHATCIPSNPSLQLENKNRSVHFNVVNLLLHPCLQKPKSVSPLLIKWLPISDIGKNKYIAFIYMESVKKEESKERQLVTALFSKCSQLWQWYNFATTVFLAFTTFAGL